MILQTFDGVNVVACAEVGILSHNIVFRGSDNTAWHGEIEACPDGFDTGLFYLNGNLHKPLSLFTLNITLSIAKIDTIVYHSH